VIEVVIDLPFVTNIACTSATRIRNKGADNRSFLLLTNELLPSTWFFYEFQTAISIPPNHSIPNPGAFSIPYGHKKNRVFYSILCLGGRGVGLDQG
jgi:hypothetical protein